QGLDLDFARSRGKVPGRAHAVTPAPPVNNEPVMTRSQAEALVNEAVARAREDSRAQMASLEAKLVAGHQADLAAAKSQMRAEQKAMLAKAQSSQSTRGWLFGSNENRDALVGDNEKNQ